MKAFELNAMASMHSPKLLTPGAGGSAWLCMTRCEYIHVSSEAASLRPTVMNNHALPPAEA